MDPIVIVGIIGILAGWISIILLDRALDRAVSVRAASVTVASAPPAETNVVNAAAIPVPLGVIQDPVALVLQELFNESYRSGRQSESLVAAQRFESYSLARCLQYSLEWGGKKQLEAASGIRQ